MDGFGLASLRPEGTAYCTYCSQDLESCVCNMPPTTKEDWDTVINSREELSLYFKELSPSDIDRIIILLQKAYLREAKVTALEATMGVRK